MKYLKKFNEELKPETYKSAGSRLSNRHGQHERGAKISQYGHELAGDLIGFWIGEGKSRSTFHLPLEFEFRECRVRIPHYPDTIYLHDKIENYYAEKISQGLGELVQRYKDGGQDLYFDIELYFDLSPRQTLLMKDLFKKIQQMKTQGTETGINDKYIVQLLSSGNSINLLNLRVHLSENIFWEDENGITVTPTEEETHDAFESMFYPSGYFVRPSIIKEYQQNNRYVDHQLLGIPCSRVEANKLKKNVISTVIQRVKPIIHELFSEHLQTKPEHFEKTISTLTNMKINDMYKDKIEYEQNEWQYLRQFGRDQ